MTIHEYALLSDAARLCKTSKQRISAWIEAGSLSGHSWHGKTIVMLSEVKALVKRPPRRGRPVKSPDT